MKKIEPVVRKIPLHQDEDVNEILYWLGKSPDERIEARHSLREHHFAMMHYDTSPRIEKIVSIRPQ